MQNILRKSRNIGVGLELDQVRQLGQNPSQLGVGLNLSRRNAQTSRPMPRTYSLQETTMSCRPRSSSGVVATASTRDCSRLRYLWGRSLKSAGFADCCTTLNELLSICQEFPNLGGLVFGCIEAVISECPTSVRDRKFTYAEVSVE